MQYRKLGRTGLKVSELSFGSWVTLHTQADVDKTYKLMKAAFDAGVNFFDNAEAYAGGKSEEIMGEAIKRLGWRRGSYLVSTKLYWGLHDTPNERNTLNRKYLLEGIAGSLQRMNLDYVDLLYCHRPDPDTPIEETTWAMHNIIERGPGAVLGHFGMGGRPDTGGDRHRGQAQSAQAGRRTACLQLAAKTSICRELPCGLQGPGIRRHDVESAGFGACCQANTSTACRITVAPPCLKCAG